MDVDEHRNAGRGHNSGHCVIVRLPGPLVDLFPGAPRRLEVEAATVAGMVDALNALWPGMKDRLTDTTPAVRRHINIFVDGERCALATPLAPGAEVFVLTAISGG
jgi:molybdopterin converting factor small subunit